MKYAGKKDQPQTECLKLLDLSCRWCTVLFDDWWWPMAYAHCTDFVGSSAGRTAGEKPPSALPEWTTKNRIDTDRKPISRRALDSRSFASVDDLRSRHALVLNCLFNGRTWRHLMVPPIASGSFAATREPAAEWKNFLPKAITVVLYWIWSHCGDFSKIIK